MPKMTLMMPLEKVTDSQIKLASGDYNNTFCTWYVCSTSNRISCTVVHKAKTNIGDSQNVLSQSTKWDVCFICVDLIWQTAFKMTIPTTRDIDLKRQNDISHHSNGGQTTV